MELSRAEASVLEEIERRGDELVALASQLISFDTTARQVGEPARQESDLQELLAGRLAAAGAEIDLFEPSADEMRGRPLVPPGLDFAGRPQLVARFPGAGDGRSLLLNGHIDAVSYEPLDAWTSHPLAPEIRDGRLYGRGSCDMKGGVAAMTFAAEVIAGLDVRLAGDLLVATNTDEESSGAGGSALVARGVRADAGVVTEPTGFDVWIACRGSSYASVTVPGRPGHAEMRQPAWQDGGAVNAIEKAVVVLEALRRLREDWAGRAEHEHPRLSRPDIVPTMAAAGEWPVTYPASCRLTCAVMFLPIQADSSGFAPAVEREVEEWILRECASDPWLAEHPPVVVWEPNSVMAMEIPESEPIVGTVQQAVGAIGRPARCAGLDSWYDGATFTRLAGTPSIAFGPSGLTLGERPVGHTVDEFVPVEELVDCSKALALTALRFCGLAKE